MVISPTNQQRPFSSHLPAKPCLKNSSFWLFREADLSNNKTLVSHLAGSVYIKLFLYCSSSVMINWLYLNSGYNEPIGWLQCNGAPVKPLWWTRSTLAGASAVPLRVWGHAKWVLESGPGRAGNSGWTHHTLLYHSETGHSWTTWWWWPRFHSHERKGMETAHGQRPWCPVGDQQGFPPKQPENKGCQPHVASALSPLPHWELFWLGSLSFGSVFQNFGNRCNGNCRSLGGWDWLKDWLKLGGQRLSQNWTEEIWKGCEWEQERLYYAGFQSF